MPSTHWHEMGIFRIDFDGKIRFHEDGIVGSMELKAKNSGISSWKRNAISETFESQGRR